MAKKRKEKLEIGDLFSIDLQNGKYAFGRAVALMDLGPVIEVFSYIGNSAEEHTKVDINKRLFPQWQILDAHSIFWIGNEGNWNIQRKEMEGLQAYNLKDIKFKIGSKGHEKLINANGEQEPLDQDKVNNYTYYGPSDDITIRNLIEFWINKRKNETN
ncbi:Imm26 family immunity protein (plasmid) [Bernardetia sp. Wsw4-3y2]|uniref:Imm26 family immunity protein n=1 Tax=Bernardetia sp. Wsw4-3y2 TaxID=3127471 RepID=UPI0030CE6768